MKRNRSLRWSQYYEDASRTTELVVTDIEHCYLKRIQARMSQDDLAKELNCSRIWLNRMEMGKESPTKLFAYWSVEPDVDEDDELYDDYYAWLD